MKGLCWGKTIAMVLLVVGGLNWGLVGVLNFNLVTFLFGEMSVATRIVYALVGLSAIGLIPQIAKACYNEMSCAMGTKPTTTA